MVATLAWALSGLLQSYPVKREAASLREGAFPTAQDSLPNNRQPTFFPVAVWYSGGKARAPMLETITADSPRLWKEDLLKITSLGFKTVRTWVEWNVGEPREGEYHLENLDLLLQLAAEVRLNVIVQVYVDSAPEWLGKK